jgi:hypothetical protein
MQTSNHFHWMSTKDTPDSGDHSPLMPYHDAVDAHERFMAVVDRLNAAVSATRAA